MLEFNADTPTSLYEAGIVQWFWLQDFDKNKDQFNSIHEKLIAYWKYLKVYLQPGKLHFTCLKETLEESYKYRVHAGLCHTGRSANKTCFYR